MSLFTPTRTDRVGLKYLQYYKPHNVYHPGIDFNFGIGNQDEGQSVVAPTWAIVEYVSPNGYNGGLGNYVVLRHPTHGVWTRFLHLEKVFCKAGEKLAPEQLFALLGDTGTTSAHLHFEVLNQKGLDFIRDYYRPYGRYPTGLSRNRVAEMFLDPAKWLRESEHPLPPRPKRVSANSARAKMSL